MADKANAWRQDCRWLVAPAWQGRDDLARRLRSSPLIAQILYNRGLQGDDEIKSFLTPRLNDLLPPEALPDCDKAADILCQAVAAGTKICIYGDYDVDGMTGTAILYRILAAHGATVDYYVPHRLEEGYGVNVSAIEKLAAEGVKLLVTVDCGISAVEALTRAAELGIETIITDHHGLGETLPPARAIVHPALPGKESPNVHLCGSGVAFKLAWAFARAHAGTPRVDEPTRNFLIEAMSLAALGVIADVVPLVGENRVLAVYGLKCLAATEHVGIKALLESARLVGERLDAFHVGFCLAPRLNACGRMGHARLAVELLARADAERCRTIATHLENANVQRQKVEREIIEQARQMHDAALLTGPDDYAVVVANENWHAGVVGIVASRLVEQYHRPAIVIAIDGEYAQGSARSIPGLHMRDALASCGQHLEHFGGHAMAGGLRLKKANLKAFARDFAAFARSILRPEDLRASLRIDAETSIADLSMPVVDQIVRLAPFGQGNPAPLVVMRNCRILSPPQRMGKTGATVSFLAGQNGTGQSAGVQSAPAHRIRCVGFHMGELPDRLMGVQTVDLAGKPMVNTFNGRSSPEFHLSDVAWD